MPKEIEFEKPLEIRVLDSIIKAAAKDVRAPCSIRCYMHYHSALEPTTMTFSGKILRGKQEVGFDAINVPGKPYEFSQMLLLQTEGNLQFLERVTDAIGKYISKYYKTGKV